MSSWPAPRQCGVLAGAALLLAPVVAADDTVHDSVHKSLRHRSYLLLEDSDGVTLYLFSGHDDGKGIQERGDSRPRATVSSALDKTRNPDPRIRVRGLTELAGDASPAALDAALTMLTDPWPAVRDEARQLILDHPSGTPLAAALGFADEEARD